jgi:hypothetical protein
MKHSLRRVVVGAALAGATFAAAPAIASASSTCSYDFNSRYVYIQDGSGDATLHVTRAPGGLIMFADGNALPGPCSGSGTLAHVDNTGTVYIQGQSASRYDTVEFDESAGPFAPTTGGKSKIKLYLMSTSKDLYELSVRGTQTAGNAFSVAGKGDIDLDGDHVVDVSETSGASDVYLYGGDSYDTFDGRGFNGHGPATVPLHMAGGAKDDTFYAGRERNYIAGDGGADDFYLNANGYPDTFTGGEGYDRAFLDTFDIGDAEAKIFPGH